MKCHPEDNHYKEDGNQSDDTPGVRDLIYQVHTGRRFVGCKHAAGRRRRFALSDLLALLGLNGWRVDSREGRFRLGPLHGACRCPGAYIDAFKMAFEEPEDSDRDNHPARGHCESRMIADPGAHDFHDNGSEKSSYVYPHVKDVEGAVFEMAALRVQLPYHGRDVRLEEAVAYDEAKQR